MRVTIRGTGLPADLPGDFPDFFADGVAVSRRHGQPHEVEVSSLYLALGAMESWGLENTTAERRKIVRALLSRRENCGGFWTHEHRKYRRGGSGLRATSAAIRVLADAAAGGNLDDPRVVVDALRIHVAYSEVLAIGGRWFLHDTAEAPGSPTPPSPFLFGSRTWGSSEENALVLNTHVDTLLTIGLVLRSCPGLSDADREAFERMRDEGLAALEPVLSPGRGIRRALFHALDGFVRRRVFRRGGREGKLTGRYFTKTRPRLKARFPGFRFRDGYLERDVGYDGRGFRYHVLNLLDLTRLALALDRDGIAPAIAALCREVAEEALEYAFASSYREFVAASIREGKGFPIGLCEALAGCFRTGRLLEEGWFSRYAGVRAKVPPSAALLGYEPSYLPPVDDETWGRVRELGVDPAAADVHPLPDGRLLVIDPGSEPAARFSG
ncbi:MAG: hypothetical protein ACYTDY_05255 [Planctomycetota bacterium]|jgi:hypothetical protein